MAPIAGTTLAAIPDDLLTLAAEASTEIAATTPTRCTSRRSAAIYTDGPARVDWRQHQMTDAVRFVREELQPAVAERCITFLSDMNLGYGAFDLIETPDGEIVFLECNPSGQFSWLEDRLGLPISAAFAAALVRRRATVD